MTARTVEIVGGGLAGLSLGLGLARAGVPVRINEADGYPRHRVCGEFIAGLGAATIARLGLASILADATRLSEVVWVRGGTALKRLRLPEPALAVSRYRLDARLAEAFVRAGGELATNRRISDAAGAEGVEGRVWTTGRARSPSPWLGLKLHVRGLALATDLEVHLGDGAYAGLSAVEDGWINVCGLFRRRPGLAAGRETVLLGYLRAAGMGALAERIAAAEIRRDSCCAVAGLGYGRAGGGRGPRPALGDAARLIPPFTGNGMAMAFQSAELALAPLRGWSEGRLAWAEAVAAMAAARRRTFRRRLAWADLLHPWLYSGVGQRGLVAAARLGAVPLRRLYLATH